MMRQNNKISHIQASCKGAKVVVTDAISADTTVRQRKKWMHLQI